MPEDNSNGGTGNGNPPPAKGGGTEGQGEGQNQFDPSKLSDEDFGKIFDDKRLFAHSRFKELNEAKNKLKELDAQRAKDEEDKLREQKKFQELAEKKEQEANDLRAKLEGERKNGQALVELQKQGITGSQLSAALKLLDLSQIKLDDSGVAQGLGDAITKLITDYPFLKSTSQTGDVGDGSNPTGTGGNPPGTFKMSQIQDPVFYDKHRDEIRKALATGKIIEDRQ